MIAGREMLYLACGRIILTLQTPCHQYNTVRESFRGVHLAAQKQVSKRSVLKPDSLLHCKMSAGRLLKMTGEAQHMRMNV